MLGVWLTLCREVAGGPGSVGMDGCTAGAARGPLAAAAAQGFSMSAWYLRLVSTTFADRRAGVCRPRSMPWTPCSGRRRRMCWCSGLDPGAACSRVPSSQATSSPHRLTRMPYPHSLHGMAYGKCLGQRAAHGNWAGSRGPLLSLVPSTRDSPPRLPKTRFEMQHTAHGRHDDVEDWNEDQPCAWT